MSVLDRLRRPALIVPLPWVRDDGGRADAGFKGYTGDCACRAVAIASGRPYREVYDDLAEWAKCWETGWASGSHPRTGYNSATFRAYMIDQGWTWTPTMFIGSGCRVHLREGELPAGRLVVSLSQHYAAVVDGAVHDTGNPTRGGTRCVYGYFRQEGDA